MDAWAMPTRDMPDSLPVATGRRRGLRARRAGNRSRESLASGKSVLYTCHMAHRAHGAGADAEIALGSALEELDSIMRVAPEQGPHDLTATLPTGETVRIQVVARSHFTVAECEALIRRLSQGGGHGLPVVVSDELTSHVRRMLTEAGISFFDRQGRVVLVLPHRTIEADVRPAPRPKGSHGGGPVRGVSGLSAALAALLSPEEPYGVRETARASALSHTAISQARAKLREALLLDDRFRPVLPDLFEATVAAWEWPSVVETRLPRLQDRLVVAAGAAWDGPYYASVAELSETVKEGVGESADEGHRWDRHAGWAVTGTQAAAAYGADVAVGIDAPVELIVPQDRYLTATRLESQGGTRDRPARLLAAPCRLAVRLRHRVPNGTARAHPLVIAIHMAKDPGRGREVLEAFEPPGVAVVWR